MAILHSNKNRRFCCLLLLFAGILVANLFVFYKSNAHPMPQSLVEVKVLEHNWRLHIQIPADSLEVAFIQEGLVPDPGPGNNERPILAPAMVKTYVENHIKAIQNNKVVPLKVVSILEPEIQTERLHNRAKYLKDQKKTEAEIRKKLSQYATKDVQKIVQQEAQKDEWVIDVDIMASPDVPFDMKYEVVAREVATHSIVVSLSQDWSRGVLPQNAKLLGTLKGEKLNIHVERGTDNGFIAWLNMVAMGGHHILAGIDHLAFLLTLILTAPVFASNGRWFPIDDKRKVLHNVLFRVTAFTIGHSISLLVTSLGWLPPAGKWVEILIALSVAISAFHALRPIFPGRESYIAAGFGLIHGMAFAEVMRNLDLSTTQLVSATLGFNIGIELVQIILVILIFPVFVIGRKHKWGKWLRISLGAICLIAALFWIINRIFFT